MHAYPHWPMTLPEWLRGLRVSVPLALVLLVTHRTESDIQALAASIAVALAIPWVVPATILLAVASAPVYMWLHTLGPVPAVLDWLGAVVLVAALAGCHINAALLATWRRTRSTDAADIGLRDFLLTRRNGEDHRIH